MAPPTTTYYTCPPGAHCTHYFYTIRRTLTHYQTDLSHSAHAHSELQLTGTVGLRNSIQAIQFQSASPAAGNVAPVFICEECMLWHTTAEAAADHLLGAEPHRVRMLAEKDALGELGVEQRVENARYYIVNVGAAGESARREAKRAKKDKSKSRAEAGNKGLERNTNYFNGPVANVVNGAVDGWNIREHRDVHQPANVAPALRPALPEVPTPQHQPPPRPVEPPATPRHLRREAAGAPRHAIPHAPAARPPRTPRHQRPVDPADTPIRVNPRPRPPPAPVQPPVVNQAQSPRPAAPPPPAPVLAPRPRRHAATKLRLHLRLRGADLIFVARLPERALRTVDELADILQLAAGDAGAEVQWGAAIRRGALKVTFTSRARVTRARVLRRDEDVAGWAAEVLRGSLVDARGEVG